MEAKLIRLRAMPVGSSSRESAKNADLQYQDDQLRAFLGCKVDTIDWARGLLLLNAGNGDVLDGVRERLLKM